jgi:hypothetical protein
VRARHRPGVQAEDCDRLRRQCRGRFTAHDACAARAAGIGAEGDRECLLHCLRARPQVQHAPTGIRAGLGQTRAAGEGAQAFQVRSITTAFAREVATR